MARRGALVVSFGLWGQYYLLPTDNYTLSPKPWPDPVEGKDEAMVCMTRAKKPFAKVRQCPVFPPLRVRRLAYYFPGLNQTLSYTP